MSTTEPAPIALRLAEWVASFNPDPHELDLATRALRDTVAVAVAARDEPLVHLLRAESELVRWAAAMHVLDYDDFHPQSFTHPSAVCLPVALHLGGSESAYLAGVGVMTRLGAALGWAHYQSGWHSTTTAGALGAAATAARSMGLGPLVTAHAIALAVPAAGGVQRAFGTDAKSLQVAMAAEAGYRAARFAQAGALGNLPALEAWLELVGPTVSEVCVEGPAVAGGLAVKVFPCCYALQRPIFGALALREQVRHDEIERLVISSPEASVAPLLYHRPLTGLEALFSLEYAVASSLVDGPPTAETFTDEAVKRPSVTALMDKTEVELEAGGESLLSGSLRLTARVKGRGDPFTQVIGLPPGSPTVPLTPNEFRLKLEHCVGSRSDEFADLAWTAAAELLRLELGAHTREAVR